MNPNNMNNYQSNNRYGNHHQYHQYPIHNGHGFNQNPRVNMTEAERKAARRSMQDDSTQRKMERETEYFWTLCDKNRRFGQKAPILPTEKEARELFGKQGSVGINFNAYEAIPVECNGPGSEGISPMGSFDEIREKLPDFVLRNILKMKYDIPTPIQKYAVPLGLAGVDLMCCAQTGSGKTCAFLLPMVVALHALSANGESSKNPEGDSKELPPPSEKRYETSVNENGVHPLAVILAPTRELASQIHFECRKLCFQSNLRALVLYGGSDIRQQLCELSFGCDIIVATPGRLIDIIDRGIVNLSQVRCLILDEADRMLDMGFEPQIREIVQLRNMPPRDDRQTYMFSATFKPEIQKLAAEFLREYVWVGVGRVGSTVENIRQVIKLSSADVYDKLRLTLEAVHETSGQTLIFVQKKRTASWLCETLRYQHNLRVDEIHSDKSQGQREASLRRFRDGHIRILVGTDVAARGLDIVDVGHVIQFDLPFTPDEFDTYIHRMGRTGRAGHTGLATSFFVPGTINGEGNGRVAPLIMQLLEENNQDIPDWFKEVHDKQVQTGRKGKKAGHNKFGSRDIRVPHGERMNMQFVGGGRGQHHQGAYIRHGHRGPRQDYHGSEYSHQHQLYSHQQPLHPQQIQQHFYVPQHSFGMPLHPTMESQVAQVNGYHPQITGEGGYGSHPHFFIPPPPNVTGAPSSIPDGQQVFPGQQQDQGAPQHQGHQQLVHDQSDQTNSSQQQVQQVMSLNSPAPDEKAGNDSDDLSPGNSHKTKRPPSLDTHQGYLPSSHGVNMTPGSYGAMPIHFMPPSPSPGNYPAPSPHFLMPPSNTTGYNYSPRTYNPSITSPSHIMRVDASQMRVDAPMFVPENQGEPSRRNQPGNR